MEVLWRKNNESSSILSLHFKHIAINDSGLYRCQCQSESESCISHSINVTVKGKQWLSFSTDFIITIQKNIVLKTRLTSVLHNDFLFLIVSGQASAEKAADNQYASVQMSDMGPPLPDSRHPSQSKQRNRSHPTPASAERQGERLYEHCNDMGSRPTSNIPSRDVIPSHRQLANNVVTQNRTEEEEAGTLVYASLNHQTPNRLQTRAIEVTEESTEYAAVRRC
ncbi:uncharacterized protein LOC122128616 [Clupea harengus]|uniref:Uncharacterized protein LOC122128616 n=1 Tax=Clupea harengus TaxID=7950 RepID=A0A8M1K8R9_CLUHA|nr:uncharacterized protein LOC122128616 [Clupea harengus]